MFLVNIPIYLLTQLREFIMVILSPLIQGNNGFLLSYPFWCLFDLKTR